jgi:hypothetical protein
VARTRLRRIPWPARLALPALLALCLAPGAAQAAPAALSIQPGSIDYGIVEVDRGGDSRQVNVQNVDVDPVTIDGTSIDGPDGSAFWTEYDDCNGRTLLANETCTIWVRFAPSRGGDHSATLHAYAGGGDFTAALTGAGGVRELTPSPALLDFETSPSAPARRARSR